MDELPQKILVPSPNALSFLSPSQRVWSNYYLRWLPEKEAARLERMIGTPSPPLVVSSPAHVSH
jgi:hypothetical protein